MPLKVHLDHCVKLAIRRKIQNHKELLNKIQCMTTVPNVIEIDLVV
jgi:hypothetical protein